MKHYLLTLTALLTIALAGPLQAENERVCWLSDLDLSKVEQTWGFAVQKDKNYTGKPLSIGGKIYERGFQTVFGGEGVDGAFELELKPGVRRFLASVGMNDEPDFRGPVEFLVYGDTQLLFSSGRMNFGDAAKPVDVPLAGKKRLLLVVKNADDKGIVNGDWADARILLDSNTSGDLVSVATPEPAEILTPKPGPAPKINGARVFGVRPGNPFFFKIPATGVAPITFAAKGLPRGLKVDPKTGVITGSISKVGEYKATLIAKNAKGQASRPFKIVVGEKLALTPPMGWASYNCWGCDITEARMRAIADAFVKTDLINHGWTYMNIDDGWQARVEKGRAGEARKAPGFGLQPNERFPDMKALCDYVHGLGLKIGIYSTPWKISYGGYTGGSGNDEKGTIDKQGETTGKYTFEVQDAKQWAEWGFDCVKYDWRPIDVENTKRMSDALRNCGRDILFTLSNSADINQADKWAQLSQFWRTTGDITDRWWSVSRIGFSQDPWKKFAGPGHWNDPDMLVVGCVGWGRPRPTHLTPNEQYTHISLWCLLSAPLLLGCDLGQADDFTLSLLTNDEVLEVDQDPLGCEAGRISSANGLEVWAKDMEDGSKAVGLFNTTYFPAKVTVKWSDLGLNGPMNIRDLWRQKDLGVFSDKYECELPRHGVVLVRIVSAKTQKTQNSVPVGTRSKAKETMSQGNASKIEALKKTIGEERLPKFYGRLDALNKDLAAKGFVKFDGLAEPMLTGYDYKQCYDWDLYFENLYLSYYGISDYCFNNFKVFLSTQQPDGFIPRAYGPLPWGKTQPFKPFLAQIAVLGSQQRGNDYEWLGASYYDGLKRYLDRWFAYDSDKNGLPVWDSADASGMDNQISRAGGIGSFTCEGADLACYLHRELECMAFIAGKLGKRSDQKSLESRASALAKAVNTILWDQKDGFYYDRNEKTGAMIRVKSVAGFLPLWAGIATPERARRLVKEHLTNEKEFWLKYPVATYAATEPDYRQGVDGCNWRGTSWIPTDYMIMHGLLRYGYKEVARDLAYRTFKMALDENPTTREFYDADTGKGNGLNPFWGWSSLAYVMPLELELGYDPTQVKSKIQPWLSRDLGVHGPGSGQSK